METNNISALLERLGEATYLFQNVTVDISKDKNLLLILIFNLYEAEIAKQ